MSFEQGKGWQLRWLLGNIITRFLLNLLSLYQISRAFLDGNELAQDENANPRQMINSDGAISNRWQSRNHF